jgi:hypothetical protein
VERSATELDYVLLGRIAEPFAELLLKQLTLFESVLRCDVVQDAIHLPHPAAARVHDARSNPDCISADVAIAFSASLSSRCSS